MATETLALNAAVDRNNIYIHMLYVYLYMVEFPSCLINEEYINYTARPKRGQAATRTWPGSSSPIVWEPRQPPKKMANNFDFCLKQWKILENCMDSWWFIMNIDKLLVNLVGSFWGSGENSLPATHERVFHLKTCEPDRRSAFCTQAIRAVPSRVQRCTTCLLSVFDSTPAQNILQQKYHIRHIGYK